MQFSSWELITPLLLFGAQAVATVVFIVQARWLAGAAMKSAIEAHDKIGIQAAAHALFREHVAKEYIDRTDLRDMERRLLDGISEVKKAVDQLRGPLLHSPTT